MIHEIEPKIYKSVQRRYYALLRRPTKAPRRRGPSPLLGLALRLRPPLSALSGGLGWGGVEARRGTRVWPLISGRRAASPWSGVSPDDAARLTSRGAAIDKRLLRPHVSLNHGCDRRSSMRALSSSSSLERRRPRRSTRASLRRCVQRSA